MDRGAWHTTVYGGTTERLTHKFFSQNKCTTLLVNQIQLKTVANFIFLSSKITADGDCGHEIMCVVARVFVCVTGLCFEGWQVAFMIYLG